MTPALERVDVLTFGETMLALRGSGRLSPGSGLTASVAGAESNAAIGLARLGHRVRWVGRVGADGPGELVQRVLRGEGIEVSVTVDPVASTGALLFEQRLPDVTAVTYWRRGSAGSALGIADLRPALAAGARVLLVSGVTCALGPDAAGAAAAAVRAARESGWRVCLDVNYRARLWDVDAARAVLAPLAAQADILIGSPEELTLLTVSGDHPEPGAVAALLLQAGAGEVVVKLGAGGAARYGPDGDRHAPALAVPVVDSVGAGDAFTAGYLSAGLDGGDAAARLRRGNLLGACAVATRGDWEGLPTRADLALLDRGPGTVIR